jgi:hypothetical protein
MQNHWTVNAVGSRLEARLTLIKALFKQKGPDVYCFLVIPRTFPGITVWLSNTYIKELSCLVLGGNDLE